MRRLLPFLIMMGPVLPAVLVAQNKGDAEKRTQCVAVYAIRATRTKDRKLHVDETLKDLKRYLRRTGYNSFSLISRQTTEAKAGSKLEMNLPDDLVVTVKVEKVAKGLVRIHMRLVRIRRPQKPGQRPKETVIIDTKYALKSKPLVVVGVKLKEGTLVLAFRLE